MRIEFKQKKPAFSLIEIIIVLFIISMGLIGILSLIVQNIQSQDYNRSNLIATQLSQEGIELIRRVRDTNFKQSNDFNYGLAEVSGVVNNYCFDYDDEGPQESGSACLLRIDEDGFYAHELIGLSSGFSRLIKVELVEEGTALKVISEVFWTGRAGNSAYIVEALLYDWYNTGI